MNKNILKRFFKYGFVGGLGILVNMGAFYTCKNYIFDGNLGSIGPIDISLNLSLFFGVALSITSNFFLNRIFTWHGIFSIYGIVQQYFLYWLGSLYSIFIQFFGTNFLVSLGAGYIASNLLSICSASLIGFYINDRVTFK